MKIDDMLFVGYFILALAIGFIGTQVGQHPTRAEVITICEELIKADSLTIYDVQYASRVERYILIQGLVLTGELEPEVLYPEIQWFMDRNEQRIEANNEKFREDR